MKKLRFSKDEGSTFYQELLQEVDQYFHNNDIPKYGNRKMYFKMGLYFSLNILLYGLMMTSSSPTLFFTFHLLMGLSVLLTAFNISHDACHGVAVKSKFWNNFLFQLSFNLQGNGFNAHALHHLLPHVCHIHYLDILPILRRLAKKHGITYMEMSYMESLKTHFRFLNKMGNSVDFQPK